MKRNLASLILVQFLLTMLLTPFSPVIAQERPSTSTTTTRLHIPLTAHTTVHIENKKDSETLTLKPEKTLLVKDYLSSTRAVVENQPSIISHSYYPYGSTISSEVPTAGFDDQGPTDSPQGVLSTDSDQRERTDRLFTGHRKLDDLTVYHAGARFYAPQLGMFPQPDKVEGPHRYAYVNANPIAFIDPAGTSATSAVRRRVKTQLSNVIHKTQAYISNLMTGKSGRELTGGSDAGSESMGSAHASLSGETALVSGAATTMIPGADEEVLRRQVQSGRFAFFMDELAESDPLTSLLWGAISPEEKSIMRFSHSSLKSPHAGRASATFDDMGDGLRLVSQEVKFSWSMFRDWRDGAIEPGIIFHPMKTIIHELRHVYQQRIPGYDPYYNPEYKWIYQDGFSKLVGDPIALRYELDAELKAFQYMHHASKALGIRNDPKTREVMWGSADTIRATLRGLKDSN